MKKLVNFRTPIDLINAFDRACAHHHHTRTQILIILMRQFVDFYHHSDVDRREPLQNPSPYHFIFKTWEQDNIHLREDERMVDNRK